MADVSFTSMSMNLDQLRRDNGALRQRIAQARTKLSECWEQYTGPDAHLFDLGNAMDFVSTAHSILRGEEPSK